MLDLKLFLANISELEHLYFNFVLIFLCIFTQLIDHFLKINNFYFIHYFFIVIILINWFILFFSIFLGFHQESRVDEILISETIIDMEQGQDFLAIGANINSFQFI